MMHIRDFTGADLETASKFVGGQLFASAGARSYWSGADELCRALSEADHALVLEHASQMVGLAVVASPREQDRNAELRMHWLQQRQVMGAVCRTLGISPLREPDAGTQRRQVALLGEVGDLLKLFVCSDEAVPEGEGLLAEAAAAWLAAHGLAGEGASHPWTVVEAADEDEPFLLQMIDAHAEDVGHPFTTLRFRIEQAGTTVAGVCAWAVCELVHIDTLVVRQDLRGQGMGEALLARVEEEARSRGCTRATVDTLSFQAPTYYPRLGYRETHREDVGAGVERIFFEKAL